MKYHECMDLGGQQQFHAAHSLYMKVVLRSLHVLNAIVCSSCRKFSQQGTGGRTGRGKAHGGSLVEAHGGILHDTSAGCTIWIRFLCQADENAKIPPMVLLQRPVVLRVELLVKRDLEVL